MPGSLQVKLLRVIQERKIRPVGENAFQDIDVRLVAATHRDLRSEIKEGRFREDLFYRLSVIPILIPPLRERKEDIQILADHFVRKYSAANGSPVTGLTRAAMAKLINLSWEGNVRELENVIERAVTLCSAPVLDVQDIVTHGTNKQKTEFFEGVADEVLPLREVEKRYIEIILQRTNGEKKEAAALLGIDRKTLYRKECEYGLKRET